MHLFFIGKLNIWQQRGRESGETTCRKGPKGRSWTHGCCRDSQLQYIRWTLYKLSYQATMLTRSLSIYLSLAFFSCTLLQVTWLMVSVILPWGHWCPLKHLVPYAPHVVCVAGAAALTGTIENQFHLTKQDDKSASFNVCKIILWMARIPYSF